MMVAIATSAATFKLNRVVIRANKAKSTHAQVMELPAKRKNCLKMSSESRTGEKCEASLLFSYTVVMGTMATGTSCLTASVRKFIS